jgi:hypothetical protein
MGFKVNKIETKDTNDGIEAGTSTVLLMASILYDDVKEKKVDEYACSIEMLYNAVSALSLFMKRNVKGFDIELPDIIKHRKHHCSYCGHSEDDVSALVQAPDGALICEECAIKCLAIIAKKEKEQKKQGD